MTIRYLDSPLYKSVKLDGSPNSLGTVGVYTEGSSFATTMTIYDTQAKTTVLSNPVTLDSAGEKEIWFDGVADIQVKDEDENIVRQILSVSSSPTATVTGNFNLVQNGSFEVDTDSDGAPDNWVLVADSGGTIAIDATSGGQVHGDNGLKFTGTGSGGGSATSDKFNVLTGGMLQTSFTYKSSASTTTNTVVINWYKFDDSASSTASTTIHSLATGNPSSFTTYVYNDLVPTDATKAEIVITGVLSSGTDKTGPTWFDNVSVTDSPATAQLSVATPINYLETSNAATGNPPSISTQGEDDIGIDFNAKNGEEMLRLRATAAAVNELTVTSTATGVKPIIQPSGESGIGFTLGDDNGLEVLNLEGVGSAVNEITITNAATGNRPSISTSGEADIGIDFENDQGEELLELIPVASAVNNVRITNAVTTAAAVIDVSETNSDLEFTRNGTGDITVDSTPIYGLVVLDTPVLLATETGTSAVSQTAVDITAQTTGVAVKAILNVTGSATSALGGALTSEVLIGEGDETLSTEVHRGIYFRSEAVSSQVLGSSDTNQITVNLASGEIFDYEIIQSATPGSRTVKIYLSGYYI